MKKITILFALLFVAFSNLLWSAEVDTVWVSEEAGNLGVISFQHPVTKNLVLEGSNKLIELDSKDGKIIKELPFTNDWGNVPYISKDGTKLLYTNVDDSYIYGYPSMELIIKLKNSRLTKFTNNSEIIMETSTDKDYSTLAKYNFITKEKTFFDPIGNIQDVATSTDGRFIAISTNAIVGSNENWTKLILVDATTMKQIALLEEVKNTGQKFLRMSFSEDGKYLATNASAYYSDFQRNIYSTETLKAIKNYNSENFNYEIVGIQFLIENLYLLSGSETSSIISDNFLVDIINDKIFFNLGKIFGTPVFNKGLNHIYYLDIKNKKIICLNITNLITGVSPIQQITIVKYQNKQLTINKKNVRKVEISDIGGRLIINKIIENLISNNTIFSLNLANGSYLINITTDKESFTHKLLVME